LHAEDIGWPPKKTGKILIAKNNIVEADFSEASLAMAA